jgi:hypothetical protein
MSIERQENRLPLPRLLGELISSGRWHQPSDAVINTVVPFLRNPVDFLLTEVRMRSESRGRCVDLPSFQQYDGKQSIARPLPWLDTDKYIFIAVNRFLGDDVAIAIDYRTSYIDPRVVASDWSDTGVCNWREVTATFSEFVGCIYGE